MPADVVDVGAGTGKLTRGLVALGHRVKAVEPLPEMLAHLRLVVPQAEALVGTAERLPLPDGSADVVVSAQAFHWFDRDVALPEFVRVLRQGGHVGLVWNTRDDRDPWVRELSAAIGNESVESRDATEPIEASGLFGPVEQAAFEYVQRLERDALLDLVRSRSYCAVMEPAGRRQVLERVGALYDERAGADGIDLPYVTQCFRATRR